jgi:hypothetical protein
MGLDMYLYKTTRAKNFEDVPQWPRYAVTVTRDGKPHPDITPARVVEIVEEIGYWRKAYSVHDWFEANLDHATRGDGYFEARVSRDELARLLKTVNQKLTQGAEVSEYERFDLLRTRTILEAALAAGDAAFSYHANW